MQSAARTEKERDVLIGQLAASGPGFVRKLLGFLGIGPKNVLNMPSIGTHSTNAVNQLGITKVSMEDRGADKQES